MHRALTAICLVIPLLFLSGVAMGEQYSLIRIQIENRQDAMTVAGLNLDRVSQGEGYVDVVMHPDELSRLDQNGLKYTVRIPDMTDYYQNRLDTKAITPGSMGGYRTLSEIELVMDSIATTHPLIVKPKWSIGQTTLGRDVWVMKVSDNPLVDENEPEIYYFAAVHAREVITPEVLIYFLHYLMSNYGIDPQVTYLVDNREMFFTLCVNPDGYAYNELIEPGGGGMWRKNRRNNGDGSFGVDLNRNYGYEWGYDNIGSSPYTYDETYRGPSAFSEPETQVMRDFITSRHFTTTISYHSSGNLFLYPYGYANVSTPDNDVFAIMGDSATAVNGYDPERSYFFYPTNGTTDDWGYGEQTLKNKNFAITVEVGGDADGFWPPTNRITPLVQENLEANLFFARFAANPEALAPPSPPLVQAVGDLDTTAFELVWSQHDEYNPAISYDVWQYRGLTRVTDDFESGSQDFDLNGFSLSMSRYHSAVTSLFSGSGDNMDHTAMAAHTIDVGVDDSLTFWTWYSTEPDWDYAYVEVSTDGLNWTSLAGNITTTSNPNGNNLGNGITGSSGSWVQAVFPLSAYSGQTISVRFRYKTDAYVSEEGFYVDDVYPLEGFDEMTQLESNYTDTTLQISGLEEDTYYYQVYGYDEQGQKSAASNMVVVTVNVGPTCNWLVGDADGDGLVNISDAVYLISYIFGGGDPATPDAVGSGDPNCDGTVNITDAVYLISYIFGGGAAPGATCTCEDYL
jgi:hypothetical protein